MTLGPFASARALLILAARAVIFGFLAVPPSDGKGGVRSMLDFDAATKRFGSLTALDRCTFTARPGRLTGFLGPNGAGKTTAMRAVVGLVELDAGTVGWHGVPVSAAERARFGYMPEERGLYPRMRVQDQLVYLGQLCGRGAGGVSRSVCDVAGGPGGGGRQSQGVCLAGAAGPGRPRGRSPGRAVARQPAARAADRRAG